jgi:thiol-disulfide isomerase/thioredoxin
MNTNFVLLLVICLFILFMLMKCNPKSSFGGSGSDDKKVYIFFSTGCGHCIRAMPEFKLAKQKCKNIELIDVSEPENKQLVDTYTKKGKIPGVPSIVKASNGEMYKGDRKADLISQFAE